VQGVESVGGSVGRIGERGVAVEVCSRRDIMGVAVAVGLGLWGRRGEDDGTASMMMINT
jgi:hypothetical protein